MMKNILITGGTRGIGKCAADILKSTGWNVTATGRSDVDMELFGNVYKYVREFKTNATSGLDAIVFSHGEWFSKPIEEHTTQPYDTQYFSRVVTPIYMIRKFLTELAMSPIGCVVFVSSTRGFIGGVETAPYSLACAAQIALVQGFAREYKGVRFNAVCPGLSDTDMGKIVVATGGAKADAVPQSAESVAQVIVDLIDGDTNGEIIRVVDGQRSSAKWSW